VGENTHAMILGFAMSESYWGRGLMTEAAGAIVDFGFKSLEIDVITCCHYSGNQRSRRVIEKCGFKYEGCIPRGETRYDGVAFDVENYSLSKEEYK